MSPSHVQLRLQHLDHGGEDPEEGLHVGLVCLDGKGPPPRYLIMLGQAAAQVFVAQVDFLQTEISRG